MSRAGENPPGTLDVLGAYFSGRSLSLSVVDLRVLQLEVLLSGVVARKRVLALVLFVAGWLPVDVGWYFWRRVTN